MNPSKVRTNFDRLPPRTRQIVRVVCERPELSIIDAARTIGVSVANARKRLVQAYTTLELEGGRPELIAIIGPLLAEHSVP